MSYLKCCNFTIISRGLKIDLALFAAAYIQAYFFKYDLKVDRPLFAAAYVGMRLVFECGLYLNAAYIGERLTLESGLHWRAAYTLENSFESQN